MSLSPRPSPAHCFYSADRMERVSSLLGREVRVLLSDGRVVEGELECLDKTVNLVLRNTREFHEARGGVLSESLGDSCKGIGTVMVPGPHVVSVFAKTLSSE